MSATSGTVVSMTKWALVTGATAGILYVLVTVLGPVSGAHFIAMAPSCTSPAAAETDAARQVRPQTVPRTRFQRSDLVCTTTTPSAA